MTIKHDSRRITDFVKDRDAWLQFVREELEPQVRLLAVDEMAAELMLARLRGEADCEDDEL